MVKGCGPKTAKFILFAFNFIFFLAGAGILGIGIWLKVDSSSLWDLMKKITDGIEFSKYDNMAFGVIDTAANVLITAGVLVFAISFLGCCGAAKQWRPLLITYGVLLIIIMGLEIGVGIYASVNGQSFEDTFKNQLGKLTKEYRYVQTRLDNKVIKISDPNANLNSETVLMNAAHAWLGCCGTTNYTELTNQPGYPYQFPPPYCCKMEDPFKLIVRDANCGGNDDGRTNPDTSNFRIGCLTKAKSFIQNRMDVVVGVAVAFGLVNLVGVICAFWLVHAINKKH